MVTRTKDGHRNVLIFETWATAGRNIKKDAHKDQEVLLVFLGDTCIYSRLANGPISLDELEDFFSY